MLHRDDIESGNVYQSEQGEARIVISVSAISGKQPIVIWRTTSVSLRAAQKAHGSCTVSSFLKWAVSFTPAAKEDWEVFASATRMREQRNADKRAIARYRRAASK